MGFSSGTMIFDPVVEELLKDKIDRKAVIKALIKALCNCDWDTESESKYWGHPLVHEAFKEAYTEEAWLWWEESDA